MTRPTKLAQRLGLFTPEQIAEACGVNPRTIRRAIQAGDLRASQVARGSCVIAAADFHDWLDRRANRPRAVPPAAHRGDR